MKQRNMGHFGVFLAAILILIGTMVTYMPVSVIAADEGGRVPYEYSVDDLNGRRIGGTMIGVIRDMHLPLGQPLVAQGWLATAEGVASYQYLWVPSGGGYAEWQTVKQVDIAARYDLAAAGIPYSSGHGSAGFSLTIDPSEGLSEGVYDVYIRAIDGMGVACDMVALLSLRYGEPDIDDGTSQVISFPRILREGEGSVSDGATVTADGVTLTAEGRVKLGELNLAAFEKLRITYTARDADAEIGANRKPILGLKSSGKHGYGQAGEAYNMTNNLLYAAIHANGEETLEIDLTEHTYYGDVWLTGYLGGEITITEIEFVYTGYVTNRVAAKINLSGDLVGAYFNGYNMTTAMGVTDSTLGDVLRLEVTEDTNDPFAFFNAGKLLAENEIILDADEYKYIVFLYRADTSINSDRMNLYLCSGPITGATEACNQGVTLQRDGKWHYLLVDLSQKENWGGIINGWRFDYVSAQSDPGDGVEFASVQFFRTAEGAKKAASQEPAKQAPFKSGSPAVFRDMSEESNVEKETYIIPSEDTYVVTEAETEPVTEPPQETETEPAMVAPDSDASESAFETGASAKGGCRSAVTGGVAGILMAIATVVMRKKD